MVIVDEGHNLGALPYIVISKFQDGGIMAMKGTTWVCFVWDVDGP